MGLDSRDRIRSMNNNPSLSHGQRKFEEYAYVLDYSQRGKSITVRGREGLVIQAVGETRLTLLELLGVQGSAFDIGERLYIGREGRSKVLSVLGKLDYNSISQSAKNDLPVVIEKIVNNNENRFVTYFNLAQAITPRIHALELIPGIGKTYMKHIIDQREKKPFESFDDIHSRIGIKDIHKLISKRIVEEIGGEARMTLFVGK